MLQYTHMSHGMTVKTTSKDILARCMATEDITVQHSASAQTASFDTMNRVLTLPVWKDMDNSMYDMLVGHEVSHALHTPAEGWQQFVGNSGMKHMFLNVVEDARIERMIKAQYPGIRRDFASAYKTLNEQDLFEISDKDISTLALIDRLNLQFKLGLHCQVPIPFSATEQQYVTRMSETETFEDVMELAQELYELQKEEDEQKQQEESGQESPGAGDGEGEQGSGSTSSDSDESGESDESGSGSSGEEGDEEGNGSGSESGEDSGASMTDDTDDGESAESTTGSESGESGEGEGSESSSLDYDDYSNAPSESAPAGSTQRSFEKGMEDLRDENSGEWKYSTLPSPILENIVVDYKTIENLWTDFIASDKNWNDEYWVETRTEQTTALQTYMNSIKGTVNQMVQQFQMKQAADADKRSEIAKTGVLDTVTMINYRWSEDIFLKNEVHPDGKNHGMVMYVDWSGSMSPILKDTVEQLLVLVEFCHKVNIPYEVYAFSSQRYNPVNNYRSDEYDEFEKNRGEQWNSTSEQDCRPHDFSLYNFLSSRMNKREFATALSNLWNLTMGCAHYGGRTPHCLHLGCTPLNEAVVCAMTQVPEFQAMHGIQIVNTVFLTDGEGHSMIRRYGYRDDKSFVTDKKSKKNYDMDRGETPALLNMLRDKTGSNLVGVRLHDSKNLRFLRYHVEDMEYARLEKQYKKENFVTMESAYDEYFIVKGDLKVETDALENLDDDASYTRIKNAFIKGGTRRKSSRVIANKMVEIFAA